MASIGVPVTGCASIETIFVKNNTKGLSPNNVKTTDINTDGFLCYTTGKANGSICNATIPYCTEQNGKHNTNCITYEKYYEYADYNLSSLTDDADSIFNKSVRYCMCEQYIKDSSLTQFADLCGNELVKFNSFTLTSY